MTDDPGRGSGNGPNGDTNPFGGLKIDFGGGASDGLGGAAPLEIVADGPAQAVPRAGGPSTEHAGGERTRAKLVIVGSGPAGLTAAIYAARANLEPIVLAGATPGGQLMITSDVENYPGFPEGIDGPELMLRFRNQAARFGTQFVDADVEQVDFADRPFRMWSRNVEYQADAVVISTGASAIWLGLESEQRLRGRGVSACATCDGFFFRDRDVAVVGGGDSAMEESLYLTKFARTVHLLHRRDEFRASKIMLERVLEHPKIDLRTNAEVVEVLGDARVDGLVVRDTATGDEQRIPMDGLFVAIGHRPNTEVFRDWLEVDHKGYLIVEGETGSRIDGVFIAGDVHDHRYRQAVTAAGDGCKAAIDAERWLESQGITEAATATAW